MANTFIAFKAQRIPTVLHYFFHGGLVDKTTGQQSSANEYASYQGYAFPLFFIWESGFKGVAKEYPHKFSVLSLSD